MSKLNLLDKAIVSVHESMGAWGKFLAANDTGKTGGHQAGIYVPKNAIDILFNKAGMRGENLERWANVRWQGVYTAKCRFIYYGKKTRNEYRITNCAVKDYNPLAEEHTGDLLILSRRDEDFYEGWVLSTEEEIESFLETFNLSPSWTGGRISSFEPLSEDKKSRWLFSFTQKLHGKFPQVETTAKAAQALENSIYNHLAWIQEKPDEKLLRWVNMEYELFRYIENSFYGDAVKKGFPSMEAFLKLANSILNRRKSRAGKSFEFHLAALFDGNNIPYVAQATTEGKKRPDFIFPSAEAYHDKTYDTRHLVVLAAKTTCKDRWRQILNEANRLRDGKKYLCTLQQGTSSAQMREMQAEGVVLIVPKPYISKYPKEFQKDILTIHRFIELVKETILPLK